MDSLPVIVKKPITCFYWIRGGCKLEDSECKFLHEVTGRIAPPPKGRAIRNGVSHEESPADSDLIDLLSGHDDRESKIELTPRSREARESREASRSHATNLRKVVESGHPYEFVKSVVASYPPEDMVNALTCRDVKFPVLSTAIDRDRADLVELFLDYGADPNCLVGSSGLPILYSAILKNNSYSVLIVSYLLAAGADPSVVPRYFWDNGIYTPDNASDSESPAHDSLETSSLNGLNMSIKHRLYQASKRASGLPPRLEKRLSLIKNSVSRADHLMIGQRTAINRVKKHLITKLVTSSDSPALMAFVGPAGHGKSFLAKFLGTVIPLSSIKRVEPTDRENLLYRGAGEESEPTELKVIFVDDRNDTDYSHLLAFLSGDADYYYIDGEQNHQHLIKRSNAVCIIASSCGDQNSLNFHERHLKIDDEDSLDAAPWNSLDTSYMTELKSRLGTSLAGYISCIVPFVPFSKTEMTVLAHEYILKATNSLTTFHGTIDGGNPKFQFVVDADVETCARLAEMTYDPVLGARSIENGVMKYFQTKLVKKYMESGLLSGAPLGGSKPNGSGKPVTLTVTVRRDQFHDIFITLK